MSMINVNVGRTGGNDLRLVTIPSGSTVDEAISAAGLNQKDTESPYRNHESCDGGDAVQDGDVVMLIRTVDHG